MDINEFNFEEYSKTEEGQKKIDALNKKRGVYSGKYPADTYYKKFFFRHASFITTILFLLGLLSAVLIFITTGDPFKAAAVIFLLVWLVVFLRYFLWAVYHYNVNYGISIQDWKNIEKAKERYKNGETVLASEINEPTFNPYRSQTFGVPPGTVRGMLAFTLLFGAIAILIASMGMEQVDLENSLIRDQFEFFKTAFLMMMAFYFGDKSLRFLQKRWKDPNGDQSNNVNGQSSGYNNALQNNNSNPTPPQNPNAPANGIINNQDQSLSESLFEEDSYLMEQDRDFAEQERIQTGFGSPSILKRSLNKNALTSFKILNDDLKIQKDQFETIDEDAEDGHMSCTSPNIPIIDAGHGGFIDGIYTTGNKKKYTFTGENQNNLEIFEGVINRQIAQKLIKKLKAEDIPFHDLTAFDQNDMSLNQRVKEINKIYKKDKSSYLLSIHSNAAAPGLKGTGTTAHGYEIWTSVGPTDSDEIAEIALQSYKKYLKEFRNRGLKQKNFVVLKRTACPAILVENLFFDNYREAQYLISEEGQEALANCLVDVVKSISCKYEA